MRSVILISPSDKEIAHLFQQWKNESTNMYVDSEKLSMVINGERIYQYGKAKGIKWFNTEYTNNKSENQNNLSALLHK